MLGLTAAAVVLQVISTNPAYEKLDANAHAMVDGLSTPMVHIDNVYYLPCGQVNAWYFDSDLYVCLELAGESEGFQRFVVAHEMGHAYVDQMHLPIVGSEEDAADEFAALMLVVTGNSDDALDAAVYYDTHKEADVVSDEHSSNARRAYRLNCMVNGAGLDAVPSCRANYIRAVHSWFELLAP